MGEKIALGFFFFFFKIVVKFTNTKNHISSSPLPIFLPTALSGAGPCS